MKRYIKVTDSLTNVIGARTKLFNASVISDADYDVEDVDVGVIHDYYFVSVTGTGEEISHFIGYLRQKGLKVEAF